MLTFLACAALLSATGFAQVAAPEPADPVPPMEAPEIASAVTDLLEQDYLSDNERRAIRIRHGLWEAADLATAGDRAIAALISGDLANPAFDDESVPAPLRAQSLRLRGEPRRALELLEGRTDAVSIRIRAESLLDLGRSDDAAQELSTLADRLKGAPIERADELVESVRGVLSLARMRGATGNGVIGYQDMLGMIARARDQLDRLSWEAFLCEAQLLYEKDRYSDAAKAATSVLELNPRCASAWALLGELSVDGFDFPRAESIAARLDALARASGGEQAASIDAALIRARVRLRQNEGAQAEAQLAPLLTAFPLNRPLLALSAACAAARFDADQTRARLDAFDAQAPGSPTAYLAAGRTMASARQYDDAAAYLKVATERAPNWAEPVIELGLSELQAGRLDTALAALERAAELDRYNIRADNSLKLLREIRTYTSVESDHFIVRCQSGVDEVLAGEMLEPLEAIFRRVTGAEAGGIDHVPQHKTVVEVYPNHRWFATRITGMPALHTIAAATGPVIAMEAPREGPGHHGAYDWRRVVQHEYTHTVTLSRTKNRLPHWFTEAGAVYLEDAPRAFNTVELLSGAYENDALFDLDTINVGFVRPRRPSDRQLAYAQGHWMYEYIITRWGAKAPLALMDLYAAGVREAAAFEQVLGISRQQFLSDFKTWAGEQLTAWGMRPTEANPDIPSLLEHEADRLKESGSTEAAPDEPTAELVARWLAEYPGNPFVLELALREAVKAGGGTLNDADVSLAERYAAARPVDPLPHRLLGRLRLSSADPTAAIPNLEYLDIREQSSNGYAIELSRLYAAKGDLDAAWRKAVRAMQIAPYDAKTREYAASVAIRRKDWSAAEHNIRALIVLEPDREVHKQRLEALEKVRKAG